MNASFLSDRTKQALQRLSGDLQIGVALDQFLGAVILEAHGELAVLAFAFDIDDRADADISSGGRACR